MSDLGRGPRSGGRARARQLCDAPSTPRHPTFHLTLLAPAALRAPTLSLIGPLRDSGWPEKLGAEAQQGDSPGVSGAVRGGSRCASHEVSQMTGPVARRQADRTPASPIRRCPRPAKLTPDVRRGTDRRSQAMDRLTLAGGEGSRTATERPPAVAATRGTVGDGTVPDGATSGRLAAGSGVRAAGG
jgi:hypothetical protein